MFSSLASFIFGSNTNCNTNSKTTDTATAAGVSEQRDRSINLVDNDNLIEVTSLTPSVTGAGDIGQTVIKSGKNKLNNNRQKNKRKGIKTPLLLTAKQTELLSPSDNCDEEEFDENDWFIVEKENEEEDVTPTGLVSGKENVAVIEIAKTEKSVNTVAVSTFAQQRRLQHVNSHSLYGGPRPQKQRNFLQKTRINTTNHPNNGLSVSALSPSRTVNNGHINNGHKATADSGITSSLYKVPTICPQKCEENPLTATNDIEDIIKIDESWFVTPPPCFTSIGPINMETSPYENLLIEHPSMSVYYSIKTAEEATESLFKLDIGVNDMVEKQKKNETTPTPRKISQTVQPRSTGLYYRLDRQCVAQLKQKLMATNVQKVQSKKERKDISRSAIKRANQVCNVQSRNHTKRRSDRQHSKIFSNANNNRKCNNNC